MLVVTDPRVPSRPGTSSSRRTRSVTALGDIETARAGSAQLARPSRWRTSRRRRSVACFRASLAFHTDVSDVAAASAAGGDPGFVLLDCRSAAARDQGHIPGAVHLPTALVAERAGRLPDRSVPVVVHCWGPGCDGATRAALALAELGHRVKEMLGGFEYWVREGLPYETATGPGQREADPLTAPVSEAECGC
jgi:rhodanese-related sulfurtransferase